jgi:hypothetical protein
MRALLGEAITLANCLPSCLIVGHIGGGVITSFRFSCLKDIAEGETENDRLHFSFHWFWPE